MGTSWQSAGVQATVSIHRRQPLVHEADRRVSDALICGDALPEGLAPLADAAGGGSLGPVQRAWETDDDLDRRVLADEVDDLTKVLLALEVARQGRHGGGQDAARVARRDADPRLPDVDAEPPPRTWGRAGQEALPTACSTAARASSTFEASVPPP